MIKILCEDETSGYDVVAAVAFETLSLCGEAIVELVTASAEEIREINEKQRKKDDVTDVLSFPMLDKIMPFTPENYPYDYDFSAGGVSVGSIVICEERAREQAENYGHGIEREKAYLFLHGFLHLLGYDHIEEKDAKIMREKEELVLGKLGLNR